MSGVSRWAETLEARGFREVEGALCLKHVTEPTLRSDLKTGSLDEPCVLCGATDETLAVSVEDLMSVFMDTFRYFYAPSDELPWDGEDGVYIGPQCDTHEAVWDLASGVFEDAVLDDALELLAAAIGDDQEWTSWGAGADADEVHYEWSRFAETVKHESRFVFLGHGNSRNDSATSFLHRLRDYVDEKNGLIHSLPSGSHVFRGRLCEKPEAIPHSAQGLGPAPTGQAAANRMSPQGISYFYGSQDLETAVAEIAGHGVDPIAVVGRFVTQRDLTVLDLTARPTLPSIYDREHRDEHKMLSFLGSFVEAITTAVIPDGRQHVEYAPTQIVTEYLRRIARPRLDGLVLPSAQTGRATYVLFFNQDGVADAASPPEPHPSQLLGYVEEAASLTLNTTDVEVVKVIRSYSVAPLWP